MKITKSPKIDAAVNDEDDSINEDAIIQEEEKQLTKSKGKKSKSNLKITDVKKPEDSVSVPYIVTEDYIAEEIWSREKGSKPSFAVRVFRDYPTFNLSAGDIVTEVDGKPIRQLKYTNRQGDTITYVPVENALLTKGIVLVPQRPIPCTFDEVIKEGLNLALKFYDCPEEDMDMFRLLVLSAQASWFLDKYTQDFTNGKLNDEVKIAGMGMFSPIIAIRGGSSTGKNRLLGGLRVNAYHPMYESYTTRVASLYRSLDIYKGSSLFLDEADSHSDENADINKYLDGRCQGSGYPRVNPSNVDQLDAFESFGYTAVTQRRGWDDNALEDRTIPFLATKSTRPNLPTVEPDEWIQEAFTLQNKLLYLRLKFWEQVHIDRVYRLPYVSNQRLNASLLVVHALEPQAQNSITDMKDAALRIEFQKREMKAESPDGQIYNTIWEFIRKTPPVNHIVTGMYYIIKEIDITGINIPLTSKDIYTELGWNNINKNIRTILHGLNLTGQAKASSLPSFIKAGNKTFRPIWFDPKHLSVALNEFVRDYNPNDSKENVWAYLKAEIQPTLQATEVSIPENTTLDKV